MKIALLPASLGHSQTTDKLSSHPPAEYEYIVKVIEFLINVELETLFLGPKDKEGQPHYLYFTLRHNLTTARNRRQFVPFPTKQDRNRNRKARQEANRLQGKAKSTSKGQGKTKSQV